MFRTKSSQYKSVLLACLGLTATCMTSCSDKEETPVNIEDFEFVTPADEIEKIDVTSPTALVGACANLSDAMRSRFTNIVEVPKAKVIIVDNNDLINYNEDIIAAYKRNAVIIILQPDGTTVTDWCAENNINTIYDRDNSSPYEVFGFNSRGHSYLMDRISLGLIDDEDVPLNSFSTWVTRAANSGLGSSDLRSNLIQRRFIPQIVTHTFMVGMSTDQLSDAGWYGAERLARNTTVDAIYTIYPMHAYAGSDFNGDIYIVDVQMTAHNAPVNNGSWTYKVNGVPTTNKGFYMTSCKMTATLDGRGTTFPDGILPTPATTSDGSTYVSGLDWTFNGSVSGGANDKNNSERIATGEWKWLNANEFELTDMTIENASANGAISYTCNVTGLPRNNNVTELPDVATGDLKCYYTWIWFVPEADGSEASHYMTVNAAPEYAGYNYTGSSSSGINVTNFVPATNTPHDKGFRVRLIHPSRTVKVQ